MLDQIPCSRFEISEAKSIVPPADGVSWERWDGSAYHGASILAMYYLFNRFGYSMVFCNFINCFAVRWDFYYLIRLLTTDNRGGTKVKLCSDNKFSNEKIHKKICELTSQQTATKACKTNKIMAKTPFEKLLARYMDLNSWIPKFPTSFGMC